MAPELIGEDKYAVTSVRYILHNIVEHRSDTIEVVGHIPLCQNVFDGLNWKLQVELDCGEGFTTFKFLPKLRREIRREYVLRGEVNSFLFNLRYRY